MRTALTSALLSASFLLVPALAAQTKIGGSSGTDVSGKTPPPGGNTGPGDTTGGAGATGGGGAGAGAPSAQPGAPAGAPTQPLGVTSAREILAAEDPTSWDRWWELNRDPYLAMRAALDRIHPRSGDGKGVDVLGDRRAGLAWNGLYREVVPALVAELETSRDERVIRTALLALARIGEAPPFRTDDDVPALRPIISGRLSSADRAIAESAVIALGVLGTHEAVRDLVEIARDTEAGRSLCGEEHVPLRTRALATYGVGISSSFLSREEVSHFAVWHLTELLQDDGLAHPDLQAACVIALGLVPLDVRVPAPARSRETRPDSSRDGEPSRTRGGEIDYLLALFRDRSAPLLVRAHAPAALARMLDHDVTAERDRVVAALLEALDPAANESSEVRTGCMLALGALADCDDDLLDQRARALLAGAIASHDAMERHFAILAFGQVAARGGERQDTAFAGLTQASRLLLDSLEHGKSRLQPWAALAMGVLGRGLHGREVSVPAGFSAALAARLAETNVPEDAAAYAIAAGLLGDARARVRIEASLERFRDERWRAHMAVALGLLGDEQALPGLEHLMAESALRPDLLESAAIGRALLGDQQLVPALVERLASAASWTEVQGLSRALAWTGDGRAIDGLVSVLRDESRTAAERAFVIEALGWIGDKEPVVWDSRLSAGLNYPAATQTLTDPWGLGILDAL